jgi:hypothetical protein
MPEQEQTLEIKGDFDEVKLTTTYSTDPYEIANHLQRLANGSGMAGKGSSRIRHALNIPMQDMAYLEATRDADWEEYNNTRSRRALARLLIRFPYWKVCDGRVV